MNTDNARHLLSSTQCTALRGMAILGIVLHNWTHWLAIAVKENEYTFTLHNARRFAYILQHPDNNILLHLFSFLGHYGVPLFLFLSGYGLVRKYEKANRAADKGALRFTAGHFAKLFRMMIIGFAVFLAVDNFTAHPFQYTIEGIVAQLVMLNNFLPEPQHVVWPGPYWFFSLMLQLYIIYRLLLYRRHDAWLLVLTLAAWAAQAVLPLDERETLNCLRYNFTGSLLPFCLGIFVARHGLPWQSRKVDMVLLVISIVAILEGSKAYQSWLWVPIAVCMAGVTIVRLLPDKILKPMVWTGTVSSALFIIHPSVRKIFLPSAHQDAPHTALIMYLIVSLVAAWLIMPLLKSRRKGPADSSLSDNTAQDSTPQQA